MQRGSGTAIQQQKTDIMKVWRIYEIACFAVQRYLLPRYL